MGRVQEQGNRSTTQDQRQDRRGASGQYDEKDARVEYRSAAQDRDPRRDDQDSVGFVAGTTPLRRWRTTSNSVTAAAAETFSDCMRPCIGILIRSSHSFNTPGRRPSPSPPSTSAIGPVISMSVWSFAACGSTP